MKDKIFIVPTNFFIDVRILIFRLRQTIFSNYRYNFLMKFFMHIIITNTYFLITVTGILQDSAVVVVPEEEEKSSKRKCKIYKDEIFNRSLLRIIFLFENLSQNYTQLKKQNSRKKRQTTIYFFFSNPDIVLRDGKRRGEERRDEIFPK